MQRRRRFFRQAQSKVIGSAPGTLIPIREAQESVISVSAYGEDNIITEVLEKPEQIQAFLDRWPVVWINVDGLGSIDVLEKLGALFDIHSLSLESVMNVHLRPKIEEYETHLFLTLRMASIRDELLDIEQVSFFVGEKFVLTIQERTGDVFDPVRKRLHKLEKRKRFLKNDYLAYTLIDAVIDGYFPVLEHYTDRLNDLEDIVVGNPDQSFIENTHDMKRDLQVMRHGIWPMREILNHLSGDTPFIKDETRPYLRSCYDHVIQVIDILETYRERAAGLTDLYLSSLSNKMNEVMKVLTIIATIFMPLGFIAGLYGMNFDPEKSPLNMPELGWYFGYPFALGLMSAFAGGLLWYFWRKGWIGKNG